MDPRRETEDRADGTLLNEEQIRADERARIEQERSAATEERMPMPDDHSTDGSFGDDPERNRGTLVAPDPDRDDRIVPVDRDRDRDDRALIAADPDRDTTVTFDRDRGDRTVVAADPDLDVADRGRDRDADEEIEVVRTRSFSVGQVLTMLVGAALVVLGVFALIQTGIDTPLNEPIEQVMGYDHSPLLGIIEVGAGALLVLFSLRPGGRWFVALLGMALVLGGLLVLAENDWIVEELGAESSYAWIPIVAGVVTVVSSLLTPRRYQRMTGVPTQRIT